MYYCIFIPALNLSPTNTSLGTCSPQENEQKFSEFGTFLDQWLVHGNPYQIWYCKFNQALMSPHIWADSVQQLTTYTSVCTFAIFLSLWWHRSSFSIFPAIFPIINATDCLLSRQQRQAISSVLSLPSKGQLLSSLQLFMSYSLPLASEAVFFSSTVSILNKEWVRRHH